LASNGNLCERRKIEICSQFGKVVLRSGMVGVLKIEEADKKLEDPLM